MILSASRRTDIPAYFTPWFLNRIQAGYALVRNPMNPRQVSQIPLTPDVVDCIVFWTKNPAPLMQHLDQLQDYSYLFQFTINPYGRDVEANVPDVWEAVDTFRRLSDQIGPDHLVWKCTPILFSPTYTPAFYLEQFEKLATALTGYTDQIIFSFIEHYAKIRRKMESQHIPVITPEQKQTFARRLAEVAGRHGLRIGSCCGEVSGADIQPCACVDRERIEKILGCRLDLSNDPNQRPSCNCIASCEIGAYNSCPHGCSYCYANLNQIDLHSHQPDSPFLLGNARPGDRVTLRKVKSNRIQQSTFLDDLPFDA